MKMEINVRPTEWIKVSRTCETDADRDPEIDQIQVLMVIFCGTS